MPDRSHDSWDGPTPRARRFFRRRPAPVKDDAFARGAEAFARFLGTPAFLVGMTIVVIAWLAWNTLMPAHLVFDSPALNFSLLTLLLSLQAAFGVPLLLLSQHRQDDRDRVQAEQDRHATERNLASTDYLTRQIASLRLALNDVATRDYVRGELRDLVRELEESNDHSAEDSPAPGHGSEASEPPPWFQELLRAEIRTAMAESAASHQTTHDHTGAAQERSPEAQRRAFDSKERSER